MRGQNLAKAEFCAPIYLAHGQVDKLFNSGYENVFFPIFVEGPDSGQSSSLPSFFIVITRAIYQLFFATQLNSKMISYFHLLLTGAGRRKETFPLSLQT